MSFTRPFLLRTVFFRTARGAGAAAGGGGGDGGAALVVITWRGEGCRYMMRLG